MSETDPILYCANHPQTTTSLRCNRCEKPICTRCAVHTPTGYRCKECVRSHQKAYETAQWFDYLISILVSAGFAFLGSLFIPQLGFFSILLAPVAGVVIAETARFLTQRRRSKRLFQAITLAAAVGSLPPLLLILLSALFGGGQFRLGILYPLIWNGAYTFIMTSSLYYRLTGIQIGR